MGCVIQIKGETGYKIFETEEQAIAYLKSHNFEIATVKDKNGIEQKVLSNVSSKKENSQIIKNSNDASFRAIEGVKSKMSTNGWDTEEYDKNAPFISVSHLLKDVRFKDKSGVDRRLFSEFIQHNYTNVLTQLMLIEEFLKYSGEDYDEDKIAELRREIFDNIPEDSHKNASFWYLRAKNKFGNFVLSSDELSNIDNLVHEENVNNFRMMLSGEILHKIFEVVLSSSSKLSKDKVIAKILPQIEVLFQEFHKKYDDHEIGNTESIINEVKSLMTDNVLNTYYEYAFEARKTIEENILANHKGASIEFLTEKKIMCDFHRPINGKNKVMGKIDLIALVDGSPHIIDLKISAKGISEWAKEKKTKTLYQLATYENMLNHIGVRSIAPVMKVYNIVVDKGSLIPQSSELRSFSEEIVNNSNITRNLEEIFDDVEKKKVNNIQSETSVSKITEEVFGKTSKKGKKELNREYLKSKINKIKKESGWIISYHVWNENGEYVNKTIDKISNDNLDSTIENILDEIQKGSEEKFANRFKSLKDKVKLLVSGELDINNFSNNIKEDVKSRIHNLFLKYGTDCKILEHELADKYNMILIETPVGIDVIYCDNNNPFISYDITDDKATLFNNISNISNDKSLKTVGNVNIMIATLVINEIIGQLQVKNSYKQIGDIVSLDLTDFSGYKMSEGSLIDNWNIIYSNYSSIIPNNITGNISNSFEKVFYYFNKLLNDLSGFETVSTKLAEKLSRNFSDSGFNNLILDKDADFKTFNYKSLDKKEKIYILENLRKILRDGYSQYFHKGRVVNEVSMLMDQIEIALSILQERELNFEKDISRFGWSSGSFLLSMDLIPSQNARIIHRMVNDGFERVHSRFNSFNSSLRSQVDKLKKDKEYSSVEALTIGYTSRIYSNLFRTKNGELVNGDLILRDPWTDDSLNKQEREFIKFALFTINKYAFGWKKIEDMQPNKLQEVHYYLPLIRNKGLINRIMDSKHKGLSIDNIKSIYNQQRNNLMQMKDTLEGTIEERRKASDEMGAIYNEFHGRTNLDARKDMIAKNGLDAFSRDIETILSTFVVTMESEKVFNNEIIPNIRGILYTLEMMGSISGKDMKNLREFIEKYMKSVIYNDSIIDPEVQKAMRLIAPIKGAAAVIALNYNLINLPREMLMGFYNNINRAMFGTYGKETFSVKDYMKAWNIMHVDAYKFVHTITKIELLNEHFHMSNMGITEIPEQTTSNKTGINALFNRLATWTVTAPDYWNRMTMFIAQMIHDGTFDAYDVKRDGDEVSLVYDMTKDKRFDVLCKYDGNIKLVPDHLKETFKKQKSLYDVMKEDMIDYEHPILDPEEANGKKDWMLYKAYTNKQRDSMKSFADITFGYYDKEVKAEFFKTAVGGVFKQFMSYMTAKKSQYFLVRTNDTARGEYEQIKNAKGELIYKGITDNDIIKYITESEYNSLSDKDKDNFQPAMAWTGSYMEGIFQSYMHLLKGLYESVKEIKTGNSKKILKELWEQYGKKGDIRHSNVLQGISDLLVSTLFMRLLYAIFFDDPEETGVDYDTQKKSKNLPTRYFLTVANGAARDANIIAALSNAVFRWEIPAFSIIGNVGKNFINAISSDNLSIWEKIWIPSVKSFGILKAFA